MMTNIRETIAELRHGLEIQTGMLRAGSCASDMEEHYRYLAQRAVASLPALLDAAEQAVSASEERADMTPAPTAADEAVRYAEGRQAGLREAVAELRTRALVATPEAARLYKEVEIALRRRANVATRGLQTATEKARAEAYAEARQTTLEKAAAELLEVGRLAIPEVARHYEQAAAVLLRRARLAAGGEGEHG